MNTLLLTAAGLVVAAGALHSILGERLILGRLSVDALPPLLGSPQFALRVLRLFWHLVSVAWWGIAVMLWVLASSPETQGARLIAIVAAVTFLTSSAVAFAIARGRHFSWVLLLIIAILLGMGARSIQG